MKVTKEQGAEQGLNTGEQVGSIKEMTGAGTQVSR